MPRSSARLSEHRLVQDEPPDVFSAKRPLPSTMVSRGVKVFIIYAHENLRALKVLLDQLAVFEERGDISASWTDHSIKPGEHCRRVIRQNLEEAQIVLLLVSSALLGSKFISRFELPVALHRHRTGRALVIPIILRECQWGESQFRHLQALPPHGKAILSRSNRDAAWSDVAGRVGAIARELRSSRVRPVLRHDLRSSPASTGRSPATRVGALGERETRVARSRRRRI
jgi:hypothetical protein